MANKKEHVKGGAEEFLYSLEKIHESWCSLFILCIIL